MKTESRRMLLGCKTDRGEPCTCSHEQFLQRPEGMSLPIREIIPSSKTTIAPGENRSCKLSRTVFTDSNGSQSIYKSANRPSYDWRNAGMVSSNHPTCVVR